MASVRDIKIDEALLVLCLAYYLEFDITEIEALRIRLSRIEIWGAHFANKLIVFSVMARWIAEMLFVLVTDKT